MMSHSRNNSYAKRDYSVEANGRASVEAIERPNKKMRRVENRESASLLSDLGTLNFKLGKYAVAETYFIEALKQIAVGRDTDKSKPDSKYIPTEHMTSSTVQCCDSSASDVKRRQELDEGMNVYTTTLPFDSSAELIVGASSLFYNVAQTYISRANYEAAIIFFKQSLIRLEMSGRSCSSQTVKTLHNLGHCYYCLGKDTEAMHYYEKGMSLASDLDLEKTDYFAALLNCVAILHFHNESTENNCLEMLKQSLALYRSNCASKKSVEIATVSNNIARVYFFQTKYQEALQIYEQTLELRRELLGTKSIDVAATSYNLGQTFQKLNNLEKAAECYNEFLDIAKQGSNTRYIALAYKGIAEVHYERAELTDAFHFFRQALDMQRSVEGTFNREVCFTLNRLGNVCFALQRYDAALTYYKEGLKVEQALYSTDHPHIIITMSNIAHIYKTLNQCSHALELYSRVHLMQIKSLGSSNLKVAETLSLMGLMHFNLTNFEDSFNCYQESLHIRRECYKTEDHLDIASTLNSVGLVLFKQDMFEMAKQCFNESLRIRRKLLGPDHCDVATLWYNIATIYFETSEFDTSIEYYREALRIERKSRGPDHSDVVVSLRHLGQVSQQAGQLDESLEYFHEALNIEKKRGKEGSSSLIKLLNLIGNVHLQQGNTTLMMKYFSEASRLYESCNDLGLEALVISGYNFYGISKMHPPCAPVA